MRLFKRSWKTAAGDTKQGPHWWAEFYVDGRRFEMNMRLTDRRSAEERASKLRLEEEQRAAGMIDPTKIHRAATIESHLVDFEKTMSSRGGTKGHVDERLGYLRAFVKAADVRRLGDLDGARAGATTVIDGARADEWLVALRDGGLSARSVNKRRAALRQFGRWLVRNRRLTFDPFLGLAKLNEDVDRRHERRALTDDELAELVKVARTRPLEDAKAPREIRGKKDARPKLKTKRETELRELGETRALLYSFAASTGLRRGELSRLRWQDLDLARGVVNVPAKSAKAKRDQWVPLRKDLAAVLEVRAKGTKASEAVFPPKAFPSLRTFKRDLVAAGIAKLVRLDDGRGAVIDSKDERGRFVDFHSLRVTFVSGLAAAGVHPRTAQALARHSSIELTMKNYTDLSMLDLKGAVELLRGGASAGSAGASSSAPAAESLSGPLSGGTVANTDKQGVTFARQCSGNEDSRASAPPGNPVFQRLGEPYARRDSNLQPSASEVPGCSGMESSNGAALRATEDEALRTAPRHGDRTGTAADPRTTVASSSSPSSARDARTHDQQLEALGRQLLAEAATAPDPTALLEAAKQLLERARAARASEKVIDVRDVRRA